MNDSNDSIFIIENDDRAREMTKTPYKSEDVLQTLIKEHPALLAGGQMAPDSDDPPRWLVVDREVGVPDQEGGSSRWALDHLLLDQHGIPTFVEVKRATDTRIRREVVGQMMDYAANAVAYWPPARIRELGVNSFGGEKQLDEAILELLAEGTDPKDSLDGFWARVGENLAVGRVRLLFVADQIPKELRRIIEFLNSHMPMVDVLGVEVVQYETAGLRAYVPRVVGRTEASERNKKRGSSSAGPPLNRSTLMAACPEPVASIFGRTLDEGTAKGLRHGWAAKSFHFKLALSDGTQVPFLYGYLPGLKDCHMFQVWLQDISKATGRGDFIRERLLQVPGIEVSGNHTMNLPLRGPNPAGVDELLQAVWELAEALAIP